jgi:hypothetical protein
MVPLNKINLYDHMHSTSSRDVIFHLLFLNNIVDTSPLAEVQEYNELNIF